MSYVSLAKLYAERFKAGVLTLEGIERVKVFREVLAAIYYEMVSDKQISRIEDLPESDKRELWDEANRTHLDKTEKIKYCKAIYALNNLL